MPPQCWDAVRWGRPQPMVQNTMRNLTRISLSLAATAAAVSGCVSSSNYAKDVNSYLGQPIDNVVLAYGPPDSSFQLGDGRWVYEWEEISVEHRPDMDDWHRTYYVQNSDGAIVPVYRPSLYGSDVEEITRLCTTRYTTSGEQVVEAVAFQGDGCRS
jgi:hypothetical protein